MASPGEALRRGPVPVGTLEHTASSFRMSEVRLLNDDRLLEYLCDMLRKRMLADGRPDVDVYWSEAVCSAVANAERQGLCYLAYDYVVDGEDNSEIARRQKRAGEDCSALLMVSSYTKPDLVANVGEVLAADMGHAKTCRLALSALCTLAVRNATNRAALRELQVLMLVDQIVTRHGLLVPELLCWAVALPSHCIPEDSSFVSAVPMIVRLQQGMKDNILFQIISLNSLHKLILQGSQYQDALVVSGGIQVVKQAMQNFPNHLSVIDPCLKILVCLARTRRLKLSGKVGVPLILSCFDAGLREKHKAKRQICNSVFSAALGVLGFVDDLELEGEEFVVQLHSRILAVLEREKSIGNESGRLAEGISVLFRRAWALLDRLAAGFKFRRSFENEFRRGKGIDLARSCLNSSDMPTAVHIRRLLDSLGEP